MGGLGTVAYAPLVIDGRWLPALTVTTDRPAVACLAAQYAGWKVDRDDYFAMGSGPGRALIRAEELYDDLDWDERASAAVLCLETREPPPAEVADYVAERAGVPPSALTLLMAPTASVAGGVQIAARVVETALHKLHELDFDVRRVLSGLRQLPAAAGGRRRHGGARADQRRRALRRPGPPDRRGRRRRPARAGRAASRPRRRRTTASRSARCSRTRTSTSTRSTRCCSARRRSGSRTSRAGAASRRASVNLEVLERSFWG